MQTQSMTLHVVAGRLMTWARAVEIERDASPINRDAKARVAKECEEMALSIRFALAECPAPVAKKPRTTKKITPSDFWAAHSAAVAAIEDRYGRRWRFEAPFGDVVQVSLPARLRSMIGPRGGKITWARDWNMPAAQYWPSGVIPGELTITPDHTRAGVPAKKDAAWWQAHGCVFVAGIGWIAEQEARIMSIKADQTMKDAALRAAKLEPRNFSEAA